MPFLRYLRPAAILSITLSAATLSTQSVCCDGTTVYLLEGQNFFTQARTRCRWPWVEVEQFLHRNRCSVVNTAVPVQILCKVPLQTISPGSCSPCRKAWIIIHNSTQIYVLSNLPLTAILPIKFRTYMLEKDRQITFVRVTLHLTILASTASPLTSRSVLIK